MRGGWRLGCRLQIDWVPPVPWFDDVPSVAGPAGVVGVLPAITLFGVVNLVTFTFVVTDGLPSGLAVSHDDTLHLPLTAPVEEPYCDGQDGKCRHTAEHPCRGRSMYVDQGVSVTFVDPTPSNLCVGVNVCKAFPSGVVWPGAAVTIVGPEDVEKLEDHGGYGVGTSCVGERMPGLLSC